MTKKSPPRNGGGAAKSASSANKALIARNLRMAFGEVTSEPIPDEWLTLLSKIDEKTGGGQ
ncbi:MAG TPA: NepR family anti-sigma factor [Terricaulis sp.]|nr:NepR family anti-sigma factor [Terricaulis sp.]